MELRKIHEIVFTGEETIVCARIIAGDEWVMLLSTGVVARYKGGEPSTQYLFSVDIPKGMQYSDGGFDLAAPCSIYACGAIVVVVNDFKTHGYAFNLEKGKKIHLWRKDYYADISRFPIAIFENDDRIPHLIYGVDWNHVQIMNLETLQILTADKSLISEDAEKYYLGSENKADHPWPTPYDYFFGELMMSPDSKKFLSKGWAWGSADVFKVYEIDHFVNNNRIKDMWVGQWDHCSRGGCWIDDETVAVLVDPLDPYSDNEGGNQPGDPMEIHFFKIGGVEVVLHKKVALPGFKDISAKLYFCKTLNVLVAFTKEVGLYICDLYGAILLRDENFKPDNFNAENGTFFTVNGLTVSTYQLFKTEI